MDPNLELFFADLRDRPKWQDDAVCAETDPELFFPEKGESVKQALMLCQGCPVKAECLEDALEHGDRWGVWGGLTERNRRKLRKEHKLRGAA